MGGRVILEHEASMKNTHTAKAQPERVDLRYVSITLGHSAAFTTCSSLREIKGPITYFSCCSATASLSASGSVATTTLALSFSASLSDNS